MKRISTSNSMTRNGPGGGSSAVIATLTLRDTGEMFHRLAAGLIVDDAGRSGPAFVPDWAVDSLSPNARPATPEEVNCWLAEHRPG
jgi:hypothetical protein